MAFISGREEEDARVYFNEAAREALKSTCLRAKCGSVIVNAGRVIGKGFNSPPANLESQRKCFIEKDSYDKKVSDKTCCVHAEQRAILDTLAKNHSKIKGATIYFIRLDKNDKPEMSKDPYCTHCSKLALDAGIKYFVLWHEEGICAYDAEEYNLISFGYGKQ